MTVMYNRLAWVILFIYLIIIINNVNNVINI